MSFLKIYYLNSLLLNYRQFIYYRYAYSYCIHYYEFTFEKSRTNIKDIPNNQLPT